SRPLSHCTAAHNVDVAYGKPPRPGLLNAIARRSPPRSIETNSPARSAIEYRSLHRHNHARVLGFGRTPMISPSNSHNGTRQRSRMRSRNPTTGSGSTTVIRLLLEVAGQGSTAPRRGSVVGESSAERDGAAGTARIDRA